MEQKESCRIVTVKFNGRLKSDEAVLFRGAMLKSMGTGISVLAHNHTEQGLRMGYPLMQYKVLGGHPALIGIGDAAEGLTGLQGEYPLLIGRSKRTFTVASIRTDTYTPAVRSTPTLYTLRRYLPLTGDNIQLYHSLPALTDRIRLLEKIITGNILSFFKGIGYHCADEIYVAVCDVLHCGQLYYKGIAFKAFDLSFLANVSLPTGIGLGKSTSVGFGLLGIEKLPEAYRKRLEQPSPLLVSE